MNDWIEINLSWNEFSNKNLANPGTIIEVEGSKHLIGDINTQRGVCDDCTAFKNNDIVTRYKVLIEKDW